MRDEIVILLAPCKYNILLNLLFHKVTRWDERQDYDSTLLVNIIYY